MSSPSAPPGAVPPAAIEPARARGGCGRAALIGCGGGLLLALVLVVAFFAYARRRPEILTDFMMGQIEKSYAPDVTAEEKERLRAAYGRFRLALVERRARKEPLERMRATFSASRGELVTREQVRELTEAFLQAAEPESSPRTAPSPGASPSAAPSASSSP